MTNNNEFEEFDYSELVNKADRKLEDELEFSKTKCRAVKGINGRWVIWDFKASTIGEE